MSAIFDYQVYARNLLSEKGYAPWRPRPVDIADVGYMLHGRWIKFFNASKEIQDTSNVLGVPEGYYPLVVGSVDEDELCGSLPITSERGEDLKYGAGVSGSALAVTQVGSSINFKSSKQQGAILVLGSDADVQDTLEITNFIKYIRKHYASWLAFANDKHNRGIHLIDLVLHQ